MAGRATAIGRCALVATASGLTGGLLAVWLTDAIPRMLPRLMAAMMETMHAKMESAGINPAEM